MTKSLKLNEILEFRTNTLEEVRKEFGLDQKGMEQSLDILQEWIKKQDHFVKKDFKRDYLERLIISSKGSVEKTKTRLDKICTMRTLVPSLFEKCNVKQDFPNLGDLYINLNMPKLSEDNYRLHIIKLQGKVTTSIIMDGYQWSIIVSKPSHYRWKEKRIATGPHFQRLLKVPRFVPQSFLCEYLRLYDYSSGMEGIVDLRDVNIMDIVTSINLVDLHNIVSLYTEGFGFRIKSITVLTDSKMVDIFVNLLRQVFSAKIGQRIYVAKDIESLHERFPRKLLPKDYGGEDKSLSEIYAKWNEVLSSKEHVSYMEEMRNAGTIEKNRRADKFNEDYLGMPGSFKILTVD